METDTKKELDYTKGCIVGNIESCNCNTNIGECKAREFTLESWQKSFYKLLDERDRLEIEINKLKSSITQEKAKAFDDGAKESYNSIIDHRDFVNPYRQDK